MKTMTCRHDQPIGECSRCLQRRETDKRYREANRDRLRPYCAAATRKWYLTHKEQKRSYDQQYRLANKESIRAYWKKHRLATKEQQREWQRKYRSANKEKEKLSGMARRYGLAPEAYEAMLKAQGGQCAICQSKERKLMVDHDHKTGRIRALVCRHCNSGLGMFGDSRTLMDCAIAYLRYHELQGAVLDGTL